MFGGWSNLRKNIAPGLCVYGGEIDFGGTKWT
jgi:hypothetical protein